MTIDSSTTVFIPGGSGGVGHFAVQIARILGAKQVITSASKDEGIKILREQYQIKDVINHGKENVVDRVRELTGGKGADIVYDSTYLESSFEKSIQTVKEGGTWIVLGDFARDGSKEAKSIAERKAKLLHADIAHYWLASDWTELRKFTQSSLNQGAKWIEEGKLKPYISQVIQLEQAENALQQIKQGKAGFGKVVVKIQ